MQVIENADEGVMAISGEVDYTVSPELRKKLHAFIEQQSGEMKLDLSELEYLDSSGLAVLIEARRLMDEKGGSLKIASITPQVEKIFQLTQVGSLFGL